MDRKGQPAVMLAEAGNEQAKVHDHHAHDGDGAGQVDAGDPRLHWATPGAGRYDVRTMA